MGTVSFVARHSMLPGRVEGATVVLEINLQDRKRSRDVRKDVERATNGDPETSYHGADTRWDLTFEPVSGDMYARLKEFLDSTAGGEEFQAWCYGTEAAPITCLRDDSGYSPRPLLPTGDRDREPYVMQISVIEVA